VHCFANRCVNCELCYVCWCVRPYLPEIAQPATEPLGSALLVEEPADLRRDGLALVTLRPRGARTCTRAAPRHCCTQSQPQQQ
jgi:hypothetical protein